MTITAARLAEQLGAELIGDGSVQIDSVANLQNAREGSLSFLSNSRYRKYLSDTRASAVIISPADIDHCSVPALVTENPYACYALAVNLLYPPQPGLAGIHETAVVDPTAVVGGHVWIGPHVIIEANTSIGEGAQIGPACIIGEGTSIGAGSRLIARVTTLKNVQIGERVTLHPGVIIGSDGFGIASLDGKWLKVQQLGSVCIGNDVDIGANTTIDRGTIEDTVIEDGVKIDNQVQVAHNVKIGAHTVIAGCVGISGSTRIGRYCKLAGGVGIVGHIEIADHVTITAMSMVSSSISNAGTYSSSLPLMENGRWRKNIVRVKVLDELVRRVNRLVPSDECK